MDGLPEQWLAAMATFAMGQHNHNETQMDYGAPVLKQIVSTIYPLFVLQYGLLMLAGIVSNVFVGYHVMRTKLYRDVTHALVLNLVLSHCVQCFVVVPMTLTVLLVQNWVFGQFFCYFLPMLQVSEETVHDVLVCHFPLYPRKLYHHSQGQQRQRSQVKSPVLYESSVTLAIRISHGLVLGVETQ